MGMSGFLKAPSCWSSSTVRLRLRGDFWPERGGNTEELLDACAGTTLFSPTICFLEAVLGSSWRERSSGGEFPLGGEENSPEETKGSLGAARSLKGQNEGEDHRLARLSSSAKAATLGKRCLGFLASAVNKTSSTAREMVGKCWRTGGGEVSRC